MKEEIKEMEKAQGLMTMEEVQEYVRNLPKVGVEEKPEYNCSIHKKLRERCKECQENGKGTQNYCVYKCEMCRGKWEAQGQEEVEELIRCVKIYEIPENNCRMYKYARCGECQTFGIEFCRNRCHYCEENSKLLEQSKKTAMRAKMTQKLKVEMKEEKKGRQVISPERSPSPPSTQRKERIIKKVSARVNKGGYLVDKFLAITLTLEDTDLRGDNEEILEEILINNFMKYTNIVRLGSIGSIYVIEYTKKGVPHLHGIVRLDTSERVKSNGKRESISSSSTIFKNKHKIGKEERGADLRMLKKPIDVIRWVGYMEKEGEIVEVDVGDKVRIMEGIE